MRTHCYSSPCMNALFAVLHSNVPMYKTNIVCQPAGVFSANMVVSMRPIPAHLVQVRTYLRARVPTCICPSIHYLFMITCVYPCVYVVSNRSDKAT